MKPQEIKEINKEDYKDAPEWFKDKFLPFLNNYLQNNTEILTKLDIFTNFISLTKELTINSDEEIQIQHSFKSQATEVKVIFADNMVKVKGLAWKNINNSTVSVKIELDKPSARCKIVILA